MLQDDSSSTNKPHRQQTHEAGLQTQGRSDPQISNESSVPSNSSNNANTNTNSLSYKLVVVQNPVRARMCGFGNKDRRPCTPPPILQLLVYNTDGTEADIDSLDLTFYTVMSHLWSEDMSCETDLVRLRPTQDSSPYSESHPVPPYQDQGAHGAPFSQNPTSPHGYSNPVASELSRNLVGGTAAQAIRLNGLNGKPGIYFIFHDLSVRKDGVFRFCFSFFDLGHQGKLINTSTDVKSKVFSDPFTVYSAKKFPGMIGCQNPIYVTAPHKAIELLSDAASEATEDDPEYPAAWWNKTGSKPIEEFKETLGYISQVFRDQGPFDGIFGFSQGTWLTTVLCSLLERVSECTQENGIGRVANESIKDMDTLFGGYPPLKFVVLVAGYYPKDGPSLTLVPQVKLKTPSLHVIGKTDAILPQEMGLRLVEKVYENATVEIHDGGMAVTVTDTASHSSKQNSNATQKSVAATDDHLHEQIFTPSKGTFESFMLPILEGRLFDSTGIENPGVSIEDTMEHIANSLPDSIRGDELSDINDRETPSHSDNTNIGDHGGSILTSMPLQTLFKEAQSMDLECEKDDSNMWSWDTISQLLGIYDSSNEGHENSFTPIAPPSSPANMESSMHNSGANDNEGNINKEDLDDFYNILANSMTESSNSSGMDGYVKPVIDSPVVREKSSMPPENNTQNTGNDALLGMYGLMFSDMTSLEQFLRTVEVDQLKKVENLIRKLRVEKEGVVGSAPDFESHHKMTLGEKNIYNTPAAHETNIHNSHMTGLESASKELSSNIDSIIATLRGAQENFVRNEGHNQSLYATQHLSSKNDSKSDDSDTSGPEIYKDVDGTPFLAFSYAQKGKPQRHSVRVDLDRAALSLIPPSFKRNNCVYPRANCPKSNYKGNRWAYETECNQLGWQLAFLNQELLAGKRGLLQRGVDSYRQVTVGRKGRSRSKKTKSEKQASNASAENERQKSASRSSNISNNLDRLMLPGSTYKTSTVTGKGENIKVINKRSISISEPSSDLTATSLPETAVPASKRQRSEAPLSGEHQIQSSDISLAESILEALQKQCRGIEESSSTSGVASPPLSACPFGLKVLAVEIYSGGRVVRMRIRVDLGSVVESEVPDEFRKQHSVFPRVFTTPIDRYKSSPGRREFELACNEIAWKLAWLNRPRLTDKILVVQKCLDTLRDRVRVPPLENLTSLPKMDNYSKAQLYNLWVFRPGKRHSSDFEISNSQASENVPSQGASHPIKPTLSQKTPIPNNSYIKPNNRPLVPRPASMSSSPSVAPKPIISKNSSTAAKTMSPVIKSPNTAPRYQNQPRPLMPNNNKTPSTIVGSRLHSVGGSFSVPLPTNSPHQTPRPAPNLRPPPKNQLPRQSYTTPQSRQSVRPPQKMVGARLPSSTGSQPSTPLQKVRPKAPMPSSGPNTFRPRPAPSSGNTIAGQRNIMPRPQATAGHKQMAPRGPTRPSLPSAATIPLRQRPPMALTPKENQLINPIPRPKSSTPARTTSPRQFPANQSIATPAHSPPSVLSAPSTPAEVSVKSQKAKAAASVLADVLRQLSQKPLNKPNENQPNAIPNNKFSQAPNVTKGQPDTVSSSSPSKIGQYTLNSSGNNQSHLHAKVAELEAILEDLHSENKK
ncbi:hypothetical protein H4219_001121 [Mycoemilia scoparia]|uniref:Velvet domain-containing protein n=1 Tax=Mycoemilia scoparia TaxID=417184 RepID=A0A9W8DW49_9FUNG|nr:hypothetical protein H4219_001121 [Mycoemilia scoparia]